ncbi:MAG: ABC transporter substrate binding protein [bacterium]
MAKVGKFLLPVFCALCSAVMPALGVYVPEKMEFTDELLRGIQAEWKGDVLVLKQWKNTPENIAVWVGIGKNASGFLLRYVLEKPIVKIVEEFNTEEERKVSVLTTRVPPEKYWEIIKNIIPGSPIVGIPEFPETSLEYLKLAEETLKKHRLKSLRFSCPNEKELFKNIRLLSFDVLWLYPNPLVKDLRTVEYLVKTSIEWGKIPLGYEEIHTRKGALFSLSVDYFQLGRQAARQAWKSYTLQQVSMEAPEKWTLTLNSKTSALFHFRIPSVLLKQAEKVY